MWPCWLVASFFLQSPSPSSSPVLMWHVCPLCLHRHRGTAYALGRGLGPTGGGLPCGGDLWKSSLEFSTTIDVAKLFEELGLVCVAWCGDARQNPLGRTGDGCGCCAASTAVLAVFPHWGRLWTHGSTTLLGVHACVTFWRRHIHESHVFCHTVSFHAGSWCLCCCSTRHCCVHGRAKAHCAVHL